MLLRHLARLTRMNVFGNVSHLSSNFLSGGLTKVCRKTLAGFSVVDEKSVCRT
jgi:hypothetical protein